jgi:hypothetical protein
MAATLVDNSTVLKAYTAFCKSSCPLHVNFLGEKRNISYPRQASNHDSSIFAKLILFLNNQKAFPVTVISL